MKEIGSEFWKYHGELDFDNSKFWKIGQDTKFVFSGRTAIDFVLEDILKNKEIKNVYFPSYACDSMILPFKEYDINIKFYDVYFENGLKYNIDILEETDMFFAMNYFGYSSSNMDKYIKEFKNKGAIVIEDATHSIFSTKRFSENSDYVIASLRKWLPINTGAIACKMQGNFALELKQYTGELIDYKKEAMELKYQYITGISKNDAIDNIMMPNANNILKNDIQILLEEIDMAKLDENYLDDLKEDYLDLYSKFNKGIEKNYKNLAIDDESYEIVQGIDLYDMVSKRQKNAKKIYETLNNFQEIKFLVEDYNKNDVLLFVPIIIDEKIKNDLRTFLINKNVYLPVHWNSENLNNNIKSKELSLVCDQRYSDYEINEYLKLIKNYLNQV